MATCNHRPRAQAGQGAALKEPAQLTAGNLARLKRAVS